MKINSNQGDSVIYHSKFLLGKKLGEGTFGDVYLAENLKDGKEAVVKVEAIDDALLEYEYYIYQKLERGPGIPRAQDFWSDGSYNYMAMERLGPTLETLLDYCGRKFSLKTVLMIADQLIDSVEFFHSKKFIHRDLKPINILMGLGKEISRVKVLFKFIIYL